MEETRRQEGDYWICIPKRMDPIFINQYKHELRVRAQIIAVYSHRHDTLLLMGTCFGGAATEGLRYPCCSSADRPRLQELLSEDGDGMGET
jgi:hypothetical protein